MKQHPAVASLRNYRVLHASCRLSHGVGGLPELTGSNLATLSALRLVVVEMRMTRGRMRTELNT
jgi:hypothetical protein